MARTSTNVKDFYMKSKDGLILTRAIGGRVLLPNTYVFDQNPEIRYDEREIVGANRTYLQVEIKSNHGWIDLAQLMKRGKPSKDSASLEYINTWIQEYSDVAELAAALAGNTLVVTRDRVDTYSTYKDGQTVPAYVNGVAYKANLIKVVPTVAEHATPEVAEPASSVNEPMASEPVAEPVVEVERV